MCVNARADASLDRRHGQRVSGEMLSLISDQINNQTNTKEGRRPFNCTAESTAKDGTVGSEDNHRDDLFNSRQGHRRFPL